MDVVSLFLRLSDLYQCFPHSYLCGEISQILFFKFTAVCSNQGFLTWKKNQKFVNMCFIRTTFFNIDHLYEVILTSWSVKIKKIVE